MAMKLEFLKFKNNDICQFEFEDCKIEIEVKTKYD